MQLIGNLQRNLSRIVVFNRIFTFSLVVSLALYVFDIQASENLISQFLYGFSFIMVFFHFLLIEVIGQIIRRKTILTTDICSWLIHLVSISGVVVVTAATFCTGNLFIASFYTIPLIISCFFSQKNIKTLAISASLFLIAYEYSGIATKKVFISNIVDKDYASVIISLTMFCMVVLSTIVVSSLRQASHKTTILQSLATTDMLTGLINRRYFDRRLAEEMARSKRHKSRLSLALFDIDHFKSINDTYGHTIGDRILKELGELITQNTRECDIPARYGGEEFALILPETTQIEAFDLLERLRQLIESHTFNRDGIPISVTVSIGIAQFDSEFSQNEFIDQADASLYKAKRTGRNKVVYGTFTIPKLSLQKS